MTRSGQAAIAAAVLLTGAGVLFRFPELIALGLATSTAVAIALVSLALRSSIETTRVVAPARVTEGDPVRSQLTLSNRRRFRTLPGLAYEELGGASVAVRLPSLRARQEFSLTVELPTTERGRFVIPPLALGHADPFRLVARSLTLGHPTIVWVHPRTVTLLPLPSRGLSDEDGHTSPYAQQGGSAFHSLREYRDGDDWRLIHWPSTARTGELVVRHNVVPDETTHLVMVDTRAHAWSDDASFLDGLRFAASWSRAATLAGCPVTLVMSSGPPVTHHTTGRSRVKPASILDRLAEAGRKEGLPSLRELATSVPADRGTAVGVITGRPVTSDVAALSSLRRRAMSLSVVQIAPDSPAASVIPGVTMLVAAGLAEAASAWNQQVRQ